MKWKNSNFSIKCDRLELPGRGESNREPQHTILLRNYGYHVENLIWSFIKVSLGYGGVHVM